MIGGSIYIISTAFQKNKLVRLKTDYKLPFKIFTPKKTRLSSYLGAGLKIVKFFSKNDYIDDFSYNIDQTDQDLNLSALAKDIIKQINKK